MQRCKLSAVSSFHGQIFVNSSFIDIFGAVAIGSRIPAPFFLFVSQILPWLYPSSHNAYSSVLVPDFQPAAVCGPVFGRNSASFQKLNGSFVFGVSFRAIVFDGFRVPAHY